MKPFKPSEEVKLYQQCLDMPESDWESFLESTCPEKPELKERVLDLLRSCDLTAGFMETPPELPETNGQTLEGRPGDRIDRYRLRELIGEGAWGSVWLAKQTGDLERRVALKILKSGMDTRDFLARFEAERQMLAMMDHPGIAHVYDAGTTDQGHPYFVMEFIPGKNLLEYSDYHRLDLEERVKLFIQVCQALQHAHQKGIIHRDLKPSNILVAEQDDHPQPKVIDFGIAKSTQQRVTDKTVYTQIHTFLGTPVYSSPEQLEHNGREIDHRSDIYSLGALLYELLCGRKVFESEQLTKGSLDDIRSAIRDTEPSRPSVRFSNLPYSEKDALARDRKNSPSKILSELNGDLDWIVLKCLEKDRGRRYESAQALANDLNNYLENRPVSAAAPSTAYRIRKFVTRQREKVPVWTLVPAAIFALLAIIFFLRSNPSTNVIAEADKTIAVLPFTNLSPDPNLAFYTDGLHKNILELLSQFDELDKVIARRSSLFFRNPERNHPEIAEKLDVRYLLEGSAYREGNSVQLSFQLHDAIREKKLWSHTIGQDSLDTLAIQAEIALAVADQLKVTPTAEELAKIHYRPTENQEAFDHYLRVGLLQGGGSPTRAERLSLLERAVELDPQFSEAWASLAMNLMGSVMYDRADPKVQERAYEALLEAEKAGPATPEFYRAKANFALSEHDSEAYTKHILDLASTDPGNRRPDRDVAIYYWRAGRLADARQNWESLARVDPLSSNWLRSIAGTYMLEGNWVKAREILRSLAAGSRTNLRPRVNLALVDYLESGNRETLVEAWEALPGIEKDPNMMQDIALIKRDLETALSYKEQLPEGSSIWLGDSHVNHCLRFEPLSLLNSLIHWKLDDLEAARNEALKAVAYLEQFAVGNKMSERRRGPSLIVAYALAGQQAKMTSQIEAIRKLGQSWGLPYLTRQLGEVNIAIAYLIMGDTDRALSTLEYAHIIEGPLHLSQELDLWFIFDDLRGNPRFEALLRGEILHPDEVAQIQEISDKSIAVLPFDNLSDREEDRYFTDGIHRDLLTKISHIPDIKCISRTSVLEYKGTTRNMKLIGEELGVEWLLEGGIQGGGNQIKIWIRLIEAATDAQLWAETYIRELTAENVFKIQEEISLVVTEALRAVLSPEEKARMEKLPTQDMAALKAYWRGNESLIEKAVSGKLEAITQFEKAIELDPNFALPYALLGKTLIDIIWDAGYDPKEQLAKAEPYILKAVELDDTASEVYAALGRLRSRQGNQEAADAAYKKALELNPNDAATLTVIGRGQSDQQEKIRLLEKAYELDPHSDEAPFLLADIHRALEEWDKFFGVLETFAEHHPENNKVLQKLGFHYLWQSGQFDEAINAYRKAWALDPSYLRAMTYIAEAYNHLGDIEKRFYWADLLRKYDKDQSFQWKSRLVRYKTIGDNAAREKLALEVIQENPKEWPPYVHLATLYLEEGHPEKALPFFKEGFPELFEPIPKFEVKNGITSLPVLKLAEVLMATGEQERADFLLRLFLNGFQPTGRNGLQNKARMLALLGEYEKAFEVIEQYMGQGGSPHYLRQHQTLAKLIERPEYQEMMTKRETELAIQLKRIQELDASGKLPPIPPLPEN